MLCPCVVCGYPIAMLSDVESLKYIPVDVMDAEGRFTFAFTPYFDRTVHRRHNFECRLKVPKIAEELYITSGPGSRLRRALRSLTEEKGSGAEERDPASEEEGRNPCDG